jgi:ectoine hydroxylase-related dioxygenase (phytanoyl-CoA dioxygenase family)
MPRLTDAQVESFFERGFLVVPGVFAAGEIAEMRLAFARLQRTAEHLGESRMFRGSQFVLGRGDRGQISIQRIVWCGAAEPVLSEYGRDPKLLRLASTILGSAEMNQLINQAHFKLPGDGVAFPWHQDSTHRRFGCGDWRDVNGKGSYVQTVTAIDDVSTDSGPLELIPGSSRLGHLGLSEEDSLPPAVLSHGTFTATMQAGDVLLFGPYTLHRSQPNVSDCPRRALINGFAYPGANSRVYPGKGAGRLLRYP